MLKEEVAFQSRNVHLRLAMVLMNLTIASALIKFATNQKKFAFNVSMVATAILDL